MESKEASSVLPHHNIKYDIPALPFELTPPLSQNIHNILSLIDGDGDGDSKKNKLWNNYFAPLTKELSVNIQTILDSKCLQATTRFEKQSFPLLKTDLYENFIAINKNLKIVRESLSLLRYYKYDKPESYTNAMFEDFKRVQICLLHLNNVICCLEQGKTAPIQVNPIRILDLIAEVDFDSNFEEDFILLPKEVTASQLDFDLLLDEKAYSDIAIPTESEAASLKAQLLEQINWTFEKMKTLFSEEALKKLVNWDEINFVLRGEHLSESHEHYKSEQELQEVYSLADSIHKINPKNPEESPAQQEARAYISLKLRHYVKRLYAGFLEQIKLNEYGRVNNLEDHFTKVILESRFDGKACTEEVLKVITDDMVNYFFNKRITVSPLMGKVEGIAHYFEKDLIDFKLIPTDIVTAASIEGFVVAFLKTCSQQKPVLGLGPAKRYLCLVTRTKVDFYLFEYDFQVYSEGIKVFMSNPSLEGVLHQAIQKVTMSMPTELKSKFTFFHLEYLEPHFNLDYKQVWLNYNAPAVQDNSIGELLQLLAYATVYILFNHKFERNEMVISIDIKYLFYFASIYLDYQDCFHHSQPTFWWEAFPFGVVPYPFRIPTPKAPKKNEMIPQENYALMAVPKKLNEVKYTALFEKTVTWKEVQQNQLKEVISKLVSTDCLHLDNLSFLEDFVSSDGNLAHTAQVIGSQVSDSLWKLTKSVASGSHDTEKPHQLKVVEENKLLFFIFSQDVHIPILMIVLDQREKRILSFIRESAANTWTQDHTTALQKSLELSLSTSLDGYSSIHVSCLFTNEAVETIFEKFYFPKVHLLKHFENQSAICFSQGERIIITEEDIQAAFCKFIHLNMLVTNSDIYRAYKAYYQKLLEPNYTFFIFPNNWKMNDFTKALQQMHHTLSSGVPYVYSAFAFDSVAGNNVYYLIFTEKSASKEYTESKSKEKIPFYHLEIFSLHSNNSDDDVEIVKAAMTYFMYSLNFEVAIDNLDKVNSEACILLNTKYQETLITVAFLKEKSQLSAAQAFRLIASSSLAHYTEINNLISQVDLKGAKKKDSTAKEIVSKKLEETKEPEKNQLSLKDIAYVEGFLGDKQKRHSISEDLSQQVVKKLESGELKQDFSTVLENYCDELNLAIFRSSTFYYCWSQNSLEKMLKAEEDFEVNVESACESLAKQVSDTLQTRAPQNIATNNTWNLCLFMVIPYDKFLEYGQLACISFRPDQAHPFTLYFLTNDKEELDVKIPQKIELILKKMRETFKDKLSPNGKEEHKYVIAKADKETIEKIHQAYYLSVFILIQSLFSDNKLSDENKPKSITTLSINSCKIVDVLNEQAHIIFRGELSLSELRTQYNSIIKIFSEVSSFIKSPCLMSFPTHSLTVSGMEQLPKVIKDLKKQFLTNSALTYFYFAFNVIFKKGIRNYISVWKRLEKNEVSVTLFTNEQEKPDSILDLLVQGYLVEKHEEFDKILRVRDVTCHYGTVAHSLFSQYLDISIYVMAYLVCSKETAPTEAISLLANSAFFFVNEFREFEKKSRSLLAPPADVNEHAGTDLP